MSLAALHLALPPFDELVKVGDIFGDAWPRLLVTAGNPHDNWFSYEFIKKDGTRDRRHYGMSGSGGCCTGTRDRAATAAIAWERLQKADRAHSVALEGNSLAFIGGRGVRYRVHW